MDAAVIEAAKGMGSTRSQILLRIKLPLAMPVIMAGIRSMVTMTIALAGIASFIGAGGLGLSLIHISFYVYSSDCFSCFSLI